MYLTIEVSGTSATRYNALEMSPQPGCLFDCRGCTNTHTSLTMLTSH